MATKNPRVVGYVSPENHAELKKFVQQQGLSESKAIDVILSQFFGSANNKSGNSESSTLAGVLARLAALEQQMAEAMGELVA
jgi:ABC-type molybdenum transport system ATPase subunit/photorepair protein PhrA